MTDKVLILVAVRLKSNRLPRKALADLYGKPVIIRLTERVQQAKIPAEVIWCTSINKQDDLIEELASECNVKCFRGAELDVMSRFVQVADQEEAATVVRVTGDNPLTDPVIMDIMIEAHLKHNAEYTYTEDLPGGTRPEIINVRMLKRCHKLLRDPDASEYMTWMLNRPDHFRTLQVSAPNRELKRPELSLTLDIESDLRTLQAIYKKFKGKPPVLQKIIRWLEQNRELLERCEHRPSTTEEKENIDFRMVVE